MTAIIFRDDKELQLHNEWMRAELDFISARDAYWAIQNRDKGFHTPDAKRADKALDAAHANVMTKRKIYNQYRFQ